MSSLFSGAKDIFVGDENKIAKPIARFSPLEFNTPGLGVNMRDGGFTVNRTPQVGNALNRLNQLGAQTVNEYGQLKDQLKPGFGALTTAGVNAIEDQRRSTVSNLRDNLSRRRVLGSSFADDAVSRTNAEFAKQNAQFRAETTLQEIQATEQLITKQYETSIQGAKAIIDQGNFESQIGAELSRQYTSVMGDLAKYEASLLRDEADGQSALLSGLLGAGLTGGLGGAFTGVGGAVGGLLGGIGDAAAGVGGFLAGGASGASDFLGGLFGGAAGAAAGGAIATGVPGFNDLGSIPMTALPPDGVAQGISVGAPTSFNSAPAATDLTANATSLAPGTAALYGGGIAGAVSLLQGEGIGIAGSKGLGAAGGAALGAQLGAGLGPMGAAGGAILGGLMGSFAGGELGKALGLTRGGGEDKPDYSLVSTDGLKDNPMASKGPWGYVGFGHQKHLTGGERYKAGLDVVTKIDQLIADQLTPEENARIKELNYGPAGAIASNTNEGGFTPARMMSHIFSNRQTVLQQALGKERYEGLGLNEIYNVLGTGDPDQINSVFGVA